jgi:hypothetical protein
MDGMTSSERKKYLFSVVTGDVTIESEGSAMPIKAASILLIEMPVTADEIKSYITKKNPIPSTEEECIGNAMTKYHRMLLMLASVAHTDGVKTFLRQMTESQVSCVSREAKEALFWVESGVRYPFRYSRIIFSNDDEIFPGEDGY